MKLLNILAIIALLILVFLIGEVVGYARATSRDGFNRTFYAMSQTEQNDFVYSVMSSTQRRYIAETWCSINNSTERVCRRAKMAPPVRSRSAPQNTDG